MDYFYAFLSLCIKKITTQENNTGLEQHEGEQKTTKCSFCGEQML